jgi:hypothetical protein
MRQRDLCSSCVRLMRTSQKKHEEKKYSISIFDKKYNSSKSTYIINKRARIYHSVKYHVIQFSEHQVADLFSNFFH